MESWKGRHVSATGEKDEAAAKDKGQVDSDKGVTEQGDPKESSEELKPASDLGIQQNPNPVVPEHQIELEQDGKAKADAEPAKDGTAGEVEPEADAKKDAAENDEPEAGKEEAKSEDDASAPSQKQVDEDLLAESDASSLLDDAAPVVPPVDAEGKKSEDSQDDEPEPKEVITSDSVPNAPDSVTNIPTNESLDVLDLEAGDADGIEPTSEKTDGDPSDSNENPAKETEANESQLGVQNLQDLAAQDDDDAGGDLKEELSEPSVPVVEPAIAADVVLPDEGIAEPGPAATGEQRGSEASEAEDLLDVGGPSLPGTGSEDLDSKLADGIDGVEVPGLDDAGASPPLAGPDLSSDVVGADQTANIVDIGVANPVGPVSDTSGIESGNVTTNVFPEADGSEAHQTIVERDDGSELRIWVDSEGIETTEVSPDGFMEETVQTFTDGSPPLEYTTTKGEDGSVTETYSDGTVVHYYSENEAGKESEKIDPDGTMTESFTDGTTITYHPENKDGSSVVEEKHLDGTVIETYSDGTTITYHPKGKDGTSVTEVVDPDGTVTETHSDGTTIIYHTDGTTEIRHPDGKVEVVEAEDVEKTDETQQQDEDKESNEDESAAAADESKADDGAEAAGQPVDDGLVDPEKLAALHESEFAFQQAVKDGSLINPVPDGEDVGTAEEGEDPNPPPGVDDPPEGESPRPDELPEEDPVTIGLAGGNIDFGPDHVDGQEANSGDTRPKEESDLQTGETGQTETDPALLDIPLKFDPETVEEAVEDVQQATTGIDAEEVLTFSPLSFDGMTEGTFADAESLGAVQEEAADIAQEIPIQPFELFEIPEALEGILTNPSSDALDGDDQNAADDGDDVF